MKEIVSDEDVIIDDVKSKPTDVEADKMYDMIVSVASDRFPLVLPPHRLPQDVLHRVEHALPEPLRRHLPRGRFARPVEHIRCIPAASALTPLPAL